MLYLFSVNFVIFRTDFDGFFSEFHEISSETVQISGYFKNAGNNWGNGVPPIINYSAQLIIGVGGSIRKLGGS